ncbi:response regulator receiver modulated serine phosphatase [Candidatus Magnetomorum sp. HK-1]|nr:response regulator receiver modulated serine phosphatase [Candidatus Magnetomorum sp. HK-1]
MSEEIKKSTIMIVDDLIINTTVLEAILSSNYSIYTSNYPFQAIQMIENILPDIILLDIIMPGMNGYDVCNHLKKNNKTKDIPIIFCTSQNDVKSETKGFEVGAVDYIVKPYNPSIVMARIKNHLELKRYQNQLEKKILEQEMNIDTAKNILNMINGKSPRYIPLSEKYTLFLDMISIPYQDEGGDHFFVKSISQNSGSTKTIISIKDQSGHNVGCILKSIATDYMHHHVLNKYKEDSLVKRFNNFNKMLCNSGLFETDEFVTGIHAEIDPDELCLNYISSGHPPFILIRKNEVIHIPSCGKPIENIPLAVYSEFIFNSGKVKLKEGDKLIFYTDGLTEMPYNNLKYIINIEELKDYIKNIIKSKLNIPVSQIVTLLLEKISKDSNETVIPGKINTSQDDISILCIEIENKKHVIEEIWSPDNTEDLYQHMHNLYNKLKKEWYKRGFQFPNLRLMPVIEESTINAWKHGNLEDPNKMIIIRWRYGNDFHLEIIDQGNGFDYNNLPDPLQPNNLEKFSGRGLFIIKNFTDKMYWNDTGNHLFMYFKKKTTIDKTNSFQ